MGFPRLSKAPIAEAAIEIRVPPATPIPLHAIDEFCSVVAEQYPVSSPLRFIAPRFDLENLDDAQTEVQTKTAYSRFGARLESEDARMVLQAKHDGLVVSRLQPYDSWEQLIAEVRKLWLIYAQLFKPAAVIRLGVRYINRIQLSYVDGFVDFDKVFTRGPQIPPTLPQSLESFYTRIVMPLPGHSATLALVQSLDAPLEDGSHFATLDLDASTATAMPPDAQSLWGQLEQLRAAKNEAFFASLHREVWEQYR